MPRLKIAVTIKLMSAITMLSQTRRGTCRHCTQTRKKKKKKKPPHRCRDFDGVPRRQRSTAAQRRPMPHATNRRWRHAISFRAALKEAQEPRNRTRDFRTADSTKRDRIRKPHVADTTQYRRTFAKLRTYDVASKGLKRVQRAANVR